MKNLLLLLLLAVFMTSCSNDIKVKLVDNYTKLSVPDYDGLYHKGDTVMLYRSTYGEYSIATTALKDADTYSTLGYCKAIVLSVD